MARSPAGGNGVYGCEADRLKTAKTVLAYYLFVALRPRFRLVSCGFGIGETASASPRMWTIWSETGFRVLAKFLAERT